MHNKHPTAPPYCAFAHTAEQSESTQTEHFLEKLTEHAAYRPIKNLYKC